MKPYQIPEASFTDNRIDRFQSPALKDVLILRSPNGTAVARTFSLDLPDAAEIPIYEESERLRIIEQIRLVLEEFYVHLRMKEAQYGYDAIRALERLAPVAADLTDQEFHQGIIQLITRTRDRHLVFYGRDPNGVSAVLPFQIERCWIGETETYVVTRLRPEYEPKHLEVGAIITHSNGIPIARQVRLNANLFDGGNEPAAIARSLEFLTQRPLSRFAWPLESWVDVAFQVDGRQYEERFDWEGFDVGAIPIAPPIGRNVVGFGGDLDLYQNQLVKRAEFARESFDERPDSTASSIDDATPAILGSTANFDYGTITTTHGTFAYIRLYHFRADDANDIAIDMIDAFREVPGTGLIIDIRGNSGGYIAAGERLLQLLTPRQITPTRFQFRATRGIRRMLEATSSFAQWKQSVDEARTTGEQFSQGYPIEGTDEDANRFGQHYFGPVVVVTDALAFSTADMFAAGFIDHQIGKVICIDKNMAAAGGNNWSFDVLRLFLPGFALAAEFKDELDNGVLSAEFRSAFNRNGVSLTENAAIGETASQFGGTLWRITDGEVRHEVRHLPWMDDDLEAYPSRGPLGLGQLPDGLAFGFTVRRCLRTGPSEGRLLEDLGIRPDVEYRPTLHDVLGKNHDLLTRAALELSRMPRYELTVESSSSGDETSIICHAANMTDLEVYIGNKHFRSFSVSTSQVEFRVPAGITALTIKGFDGEKLVANRIATIGRREPTSEVA